MQPSPQRIAEIEAALKAHGYEPGTTWEEREKFAGKIADEHMWQTDHAPDVRVLILIGLAGPHSDPAVAQMHGDRRSRPTEEASRETQSAEGYAETPVPPSVPPATHSSVPAASSKRPAASSSPVASVRAVVKARAKDT